MGFIGDTAAERGIEQGSAVYFLGGENTFTDTEPCVVKKGIVSGDVRQTWAPEIVVQEGFDDETSLDTGDRISMHIGNLFTPAEIIEALNDSRNQAAPGNTLTDEAAGEIDAVLSYQVGNHMAARALMNALEQRTKETARLLIY